MNMGELIEDVSVPVEEVVELRRGRKVSFGAQVLFRDMCW